MVGFLGNHNGNGVKVLVGLILSIRLVVSKNTYSAFFPAALAGVIRMTLAL